MPDTLTARLRPRDAAPMPVLEFTRPRARALVAAATAAVMAGVAMLLWVFGGPLALQDDAAQTVGTARHLLAGDGLVTSILYYESQLAQGLPAAQTVWPPGLPALVAAVAGLTGVPVVDVLLLVGIAAHLLCAAAIGRLVTRAGAGPAVGTAAAVAWAVAVPAWLGVTRGLAEPMTMAFSLIAACAIEALAGRPAGRRGGALALLAFALAAALSMRYQAIALIPPAMGAVWIALGGRRPAVLPALLVAVPAGALLASLFGRNLALTGSLTGGASARSGQTLGEIAARMSWVDGPWQGFVLALLILAAVVCAALAVRVCRHPSRTPRAALTVFCLGGFAANIGLLLALASTSTVYVLEMRYVLAAGVLLLPVLLPAIADRVGAMPRSEAFGRALPGPASSVLAAGILTLALGQVVALWPSFVARVSGTPAARIHEVFAAHAVDGVPLATWLRERAGSTPILSTHPHGLAVVADVATAGVPLPVYLDHPYDAAAIRTLADRLDVRWLVAFRTMPTWVYRDPVNRMLDQPDCSSWLETVIASDALIVARVRTGAGAICAREIAAHDLARRTRLRADVARAQQLLAPHRPEGRPAGPSGPDGRPLNGSVGLAMMHPAVVLSGPTATGTKTPRE